MTGGKLGARLWLAAVYVLGLMILAAAGPARAQTVDFKQLIPFVDLKLSGWTANSKPDGTTNKEGDFTLSEARATYRSGDRTMEIVVMDFKGKIIPFLGPDDQMQRETSEETRRATTLRGLKAMEIFRPQDRHGELNISVADRFWVKINGDGIDNLEVLRAVAQQMNLPKLAELSK